MGLKKFRPCRLQKRLGQKCMYPLHLAALVNVDLAWAEEGPNQVRSYDF